MTAINFGKNIKSCVISTAYHLGVFGFLRRLQCNRVTILMYHRFSAEYEPFKLSCKVFERQMQYLVQRYNVISFNDYLNAHDDKYHRLPVNPLLITIDDGYQDCFDYAFPILNKLNIPVTVFLTTNFISNREWLWSNKLEYILKNSKFKTFDLRLGGRTETFDVNCIAGWHRTQLRIFEYCRSIENFRKNAFLDQLAWELDVLVPPVVTDEFAPLSWEQIQTMHCQGVTFGSHSSSHPICSRLNDAELKYEIADSKRTIEERLSVPVDLFCYPNGQFEDFSDREVQFLKDSGYSAAVTTVHGTNRFNNPDLFRLNRISIGAETSVALSRSLTRFQRRI